MKKILSLVTLALLFNSCDDGDIVIEDISFEDGTPTKCTTNNIIYKTKDNEALIFDASGITFPTEEGSQEITINSSNRVLYRFYNGPVTSATLCETIPPATPIVINEWIATKGIIVINTKANKEPNTTDNSNRITGYNHNISFKNIEFTKTDSAPQTYPTFFFGDYKTTATPLPFSFTKVLKQCPTSKQLYDRNSAEALILDIDPSLISNTPTPLNTPRTALISTTTNKLTYRLFGGLLTDDYFCNTTYPTTPVVNEEWLGVTGVANTSGIIEVTTTSFGNGFKHTIVLKKVKMKKGNNDFLLGDNYIYGELLTTN
ncbi:hypothetical protein [Flavobacterium turcicum]|uniref:Lipoprotein n=1 Tax=Flavobacterium turcicum TaxID=2764718 RepID=A0ABR7JHR5_9FLAO|nr:hypothetical protein [Flavobacterium turcicum]MBC5864045.1 hypothetical protein [Flavobacterium turcicum]NHL02811.1 hypothetical protein [Flavobacterium turcicum]